VVDGEQPAIFRRLDDVAAHHRRQRQVTAQQVQVVAREQHHLAGPEDEGLGTLDAHVELPRDDVVIEDQVGRRAEQRGAMLGRHTRRHAPRRAELSMQEHAAREMGHPQDIR
jgi:hypothetical protein